MPKASRTVIIWTEGGQRYGLPLGAVRKAVRMVAITPVPTAPPGVLGIINVEGRVTAVISLERRYQSGTAGEAAGFNDSLILCQSASRGAALVAHEVHGLSDVLEEEWVPPAEVDPGLEHLAAVLKRPDGLVFVPDLEALVSAEERQHLDRAVLSRGEGG